MFGLETVVYWNAAAIGALVVVLMAGLCGAFLFSLRSADRSTLLLALTFLFTAAFNGGYVVAFLVPNSWAAWHRWITVPSVLVVITFMTAFVSKFGDDPFPSATRGLIRWGLGLGAVATGMFCWSSLNTTPTFDFTAGAWDFERPGPNVNFAIGIAAYVGVFLVVAGRQIVRIAPPSRYALLALCVSFLIASVVPSITNITSRNGSFPRGLHHFLSTILFVVGLFLIAIIYINTTTERTTIMAKIVGVSVVTFLLIFQVISMFALADREHVYDSARLQDLALHELGGRTRSRLRYMDRYDFSAGASEARRLVGTDVPAPNDASSAAEVRNVLFYERLRAHAGGTTTRSGSWWRGE